MCHYLIRDNVWQFWHLWDDISIRRKSACIMDRLSLSPFLSLSKVPYGMRSVRRHKMFVRREGIFLLCLCLEWSVVFIDTVSDMPLYLSLACSETHTYTLYISICSQASCANKVLLIMTPDSASGKIIPPLEKKVETTNWDLRAKDQSQCQRVSKDALTSRPLLTFHQALAAPRSPLSLAFWVHFSLSSFSFNGGFLVVLLQALQACSPQIGVIDTYMCFEDIL